ncbi:MAG: S26 family signal peptidase [Jatrophihabitans sp.]
MRRTLGPAVGLLLAALLLARRCCTMVTVRGHSMNPTLSDGQRVLAIRHPHYRAGQIIVFHTPGGTGTPGDPDYRVKRVIAVGGEPRPDALADPALPAVVPRGHLAVAGDNARHSQDSRHLGYIPTSKIIGRVRR